MSARTRRGANPDATETETSTDQTQPEATEGTAPEATDSPSTEGTQPEATVPTVQPAEAAKPIDLVPFQTAVAAAAQQGDDTTGMLPESAYAGPNEEYAKLEGAKAKGAAKRWLGEKMQELLMEGVKDPSKVALARAYMQVQHKLTASKAKSGEATEKTPVDLTADLVSQVAALRLAETLVKVPDGVKEDWQDQVSKTVTDLGDQVTKYREWAEAEVPEGQTRPDAPEVSPIVVRAFKLATGRATGRKASTTASGTASTPHEGPRRSVAAHIKAAFDGKPAGTFLTIAEIAGHRSDEYGDDKPSSGAVSAALFTKEGGAKEKGGAKGAMSDGKRGAVKVAEKAAAA